MSRDESRSSSRHRSGGRFAKAADVRSSASPAANPPGANPAVEQFRGASRRPPIHALEQALFFVVSAHLIMLPWALGTMRLPAQICSLVLAVLGFVLALMPRTVIGERQEARGERAITGERAGPENAERLKTETLKSADPRGTPALPGQSQISNLKSQIAAQPVTYSLLLWPKLLRFPVFWLGLALLALIVVQGLNPAWVYQTNGKGWWMKAIPHATWLPSGVEVPFVNVPGAPQGGPWRMLLIYASAWLTVCAIWVGFTRRRTLQRLFVVIAANGLALALFGLAQRILGATKLFWSVDSPNPSFFSSFIYKNHAGGYLLVTLAVAAGLGAWYYARAVRRLDKSSPAGLFAFFVTCIAVSILVSYARGATLVMLGYLTLVVIGFTVFQWRLPAAARSPVITVALLLMFGLFLKTGMDALQSGLAWDRLRHALSGQDLSVEARQIATQASTDMLAENWGTGVGSGSFPFLFPAHLKDYPRIGVNRFWPHAHNDILEIPIELGLPGVLLIIGALGYWTFLLVRNYGWQNPFTAPVIVGLLFLVGMSWGDFVFYCPAILITWCALWPAVTRWTMLEEAKQ